MVLKLFRKLMPRDERFVERICRHSGHVVDGAAQFRDIIAGGDYDTHCKELFRLEDAADDVTREIVHAVHASFITPFDRSEILELTTALDDTIDLMKDAARRMGLYKVEYTPEMRGMAECAVRASAAIKEALPALGAIGKNQAVFAEMQRKVRAAESEADDLLQRGLQTLFAGPGPAGDKFAIEKVYELIEAVVDRCEDVTDVIAGIVVEHV
jgi:predicted phosphate transport protein (TIGR00153 family)